MLFINHANDTKAAKDYFTEHLSKSDYYVKDAQEIAGEWHGRAAELLGLKGQVDKDSYFRLCENVNPMTGEQVTPRVKADRRVLYDFTFDAPKSVTLAYEVGGDDRIMDAFRDSVRETMGEMEDAMRVRVRKNGAREDRQTSNMIWGEFIHRTTRPITEDGVSLPDPQLHCHAVAINATYDPAGRQIFAQVHPVLPDRCLKDGLPVLRLAEEFYAQVVFIYRLLIEVVPHQRRTSAGMASAWRSMSIRNPALKHGARRRRCW